MSFLMHNQSTAIGASRPIRSNHRIQDHAIEVILTGTSGDITACTVALQGGNSNRETCVSTPAVLAVGVTEEYVANSAFYYQIKGTNYTIAANTNGTSIETIDGNAIDQTMAAGVYGGVVVVANTSGELKFITPDGAATGAQTTTSMVDCNTSLDGIYIPEDYCYVGRVIVPDIGGATFNATAMTTSDFIDAYCPYYTLESHVLTEDEISAQRAYFTVSGKHAKYIRTYISALTGIGNVTVKYNPVNE